MNVRNASKMLSTYNVAQWGNSYYDDNEKATSAYVRTPIFFPQARVDLVKACQERRSESPRIVFFPQILQHRLRPINAAFQAPVTPLAIRATIFWYTQLR